MESRLNVLGVMTQKKADSVLESTFYVPEAGLEPARGLSLTGF